MKLKLEVEGIEEPVEVEIDGRDRRAFERTGYRELNFPPLSSLREIVTAAPESYTIWLAWHSLVRRGKRTEFGTYLDFESRVLASPTADEENDIEQLLDDPTVTAS